MLKTLNYNKYLLIPAILVAVFLFLPQGNANASTTETGVEDKIELLNTLLSKIDVLMNLMRDREDFFENKDVIARTEPGKRSEDFFLRLAKDSAAAVYGSDSASILIETDGGVRQIVVTSACADDNFETLLMGNSSCSEEVWLTQSTMNNGVQTFVVPVAVDTKQEEGDVKLSVFACRYDGCVFETDLSIPYKEKITFADQVHIYDRYEWTYEWDGDIYHVQEVLVDFPYYDVRIVKLRVRCDVPGLYISTDEDNRLSCNERGRFSNVDFRNPKTDEQGNTYNLVIESVTRNISKDDAGSVELEFAFVDKHNGITFMYHRPMQKEVEAEAGAEEVESNL